MEAQREQKRKEEAERLRQAEERERKARELENGVILSFRELDEKRRMAERQREMDKALAEHTARQKVLDEAKAAKEAAKRGLRYISLASSFSGS